MTADHGSPPVPRLPRADFVRSLCCAAVPSRPSASSPLTSHSHVQFDRTSPLPSPAPPDAPSSPPLTSLVHSAAQRPSAPPSAPAAMSSAAPNRRVRRRDDDKGQPEETSQSREGDQTAVAVGVVGQTASSADRDGSQPQPPSAGLGVQPLPEQSGQQEAAAICPAGVPSQPAGSRRVAALSAVSGHEERGNGQRDGRVTQQ